MMDGIADGLLLPSLCIAHNLFDEAINEGGGDGAQTAPAMKRKRLEGVSFGGKSWYRSSFVRSATMRASRQLSTLRG